MVCIDGEFIAVDGTSASAPIFAGVITLLNDVRIKVKMAGKFLLMIEWKITVRIFEPIVI